MASRSRGSVFLIQLALGIFFIALGIEGIATYNSQINEFARAVGRFFGSQNDIIPLIFAIVEVVAGVVILLEIFVPVDSRMFFIASLVILVFWGVVMVLRYITGGNFLEPDYLPWIAAFSKDLVILSALWIVTGKART